MKLKLFMVLIFIYIQYYSTMKLGLVTILVVFTNLHLKDPKEFARICSGFMKKKVLTGIIRKIWLRSLKSIFNIR